MKLNENTKIYLATLLTIKTFLTTSNYNKKLITFNENNLKS